MNCPICYSINLKRAEKYNNYNLYHCRDCEVRFWWPLRYPGKDFYESSYMFDIIEKRKTSWYHKQFLKKPPIEKGILLDIGCGQGEFLGATLKKGGFNLWGLDISKKNIDFIKKTYKIDKVFNETLDSFCEKKDIPQFDAVTLFEVIEHLANPKEVIENIKKIIKPGGSLILSMPNRDRLGGTKEDWDYPPNHLFQWNKKSISSFLISHGFEISNIIEQPFSKDFFFIRGTLSLGIMKYFRKKAGIVSPKKGGEAVSNIINNKSLLFYIMKFFAVIKNLILSPFLSIFSFFLRILGFKYWSMYVEAKVKT